jgi:hypothetical protein
MSIGTSLVVLGMAAWAAGGAVPNAVKLTSVELRAAEPVGNGLSARLEAQIVARGIPAGSCSMTLMLSSSGRASDASGIRARGVVTGSDYRKQRALTPSDFVIAAEADSTGMVVADAVFDGEDVRRLPADEVRLVVSIAPVRHPERVLVAERAVRITRRDFGWLDAHLLLAHWVGHQGLLTRVEVAAPGRVTIAVAVLDKGGAPVASGAYAGNLSRGTHDIVVPLRGRGHWCKSDSRYLVAVDGYYPVGWPDHMPN